MRGAVLGSVLGAGLVVVLAACWQASQAEAQLPVERLPGRAVHPGSLTALSIDVDQRRQQIAVIDGDTRTMAVYHVDKVNGEVSLKSVRNIHWDLQMEEFNGKSPLPREIRSLLEQR